MSKRDRISTPYTYTPGHVVTMVEQGRLGVYHTRPIASGTPYPRLTRIAYSANLSRHKLLKGEASVELIRWARLGGRFDYELTGSDPEPPREVPAVWFHVTRDRTTSAQALLAYSEPFPDELVTNWGQATPEEVAEYVRAYVRWRHTLCSSTRLDPTETELDTLVERSLALPRDRQREVRP